MEYPFSNSIQLFASKEMEKIEALTAEFIRCFDLLYPGQDKKIKIQNCTAFCSCLLFPDYNVFFIFWKKKVVYNHSAKFFWDVYTVKSVNAQEKGDPG